MTMEIRGQVFDDRVVMQISASAETEPSGK